MKVKIISHYFLFRCFGKGAQFNTEFTFIPYTAFYK